MPLIETELGKALDYSVKRKANRTRNLRSIASVITRKTGNGSSEVMVKITGFGKGASHAQAHITYISRNSKLELENDRGDIFKGEEEINAYFKSWEQDFNGTKRYKNQRDTLHLVLSMPENTAPEAVKNAVREFSKVTFSYNHDYVFVLHTDEKHPHCHLAVKSLGFNTKRLNPRKADLQHWRESFAEKLREQGIDAEATPRSSRGVIKKAESSVIRHIEQGDKTHQPRVSKVKAMKIKQAVEELVAETQGLSIEPKPWDAAIQAKQDSVRKAWLNSATTLEKHTHSDHENNGYEDKKLANNIRHFVSVMPAIETERDQIKQKLLLKFTKQPEITRSNNENTVHNSKLKNELER
jgi:type IV secretory pathway VirD2 relaxase